jgi:outer membrane protein
MKKYKITLATVLFMLVAIFAIAPQAHAQKFAYVDTEYILSQLPTYRSAQKQVDELSEKWQKEIDNMYQDIDKMYKNYQAEKVILSGELQKKREEEIVAKDAKN